jgi:hypothetical protein
MQTPKIQNEARCQKYLWHATVPTTHFLSSPPVLIFFSCRSPHSSPSLSFSVLPPLRALDHGRQRGQHRIFHDGAGVPDGILVVYRDKHQHHPHGKVKGSASALMPRHLLSEPELEPPHAACTEPEPELPISTPGERLLYFFPPPSAPPTVALSPFPLSS